MVVKNKARLVAKCYSQQEGINYTETYAIVSRLEVIHILLSFVIFSSNKIYHKKLKTKTTLKKCKWSRKFFTKNGTYQ